GHTPGVAGTIPGSTTGVDVTPPPTLGWPFPDTVRTSNGEYAVLSVQQAEGVRADNAGPIEIAVGGWQSNLLNGLFCALGRPGLVGELENQCLYDRWLSVRPEPHGLHYDPP